MLCLINHREMQAEIHAVIRQPSEYELKERQHAALVRTGNNWTSHICQWECKIAKEPGELLGCIY